MFDKRQRATRAVERQVRECDATRQDVTSGVEEAHHRAGERECLGRR